MTLLLLLLGCAPDDGRVPLQYCEDGDPAPTAAPATEPLTWHGDAGPIVAAKCTGCHTDGGLAPFSLESHGAVASRADLIRAAVTSGRMPPWSADDCCGKEYRFDRRLSQAELDTLVGWLDQGAPEGDPSEVPDDPPESIGLPRVDLEVAMPAPYLATPRWNTHDDVRCFLLDIPPEATGRFVVGGEVIPGTTTIVHHVATAVVLPKQLAAFEKLDADDPEPGWDCYGGQGAIAGGSLGGWVPGQGALVMPEGLGLELPQDAKLLLNIHYDLSNVDGTPTEDQTALQYMLADEVDQLVRAIPVIHPLWLFDRGMAIEGGGETTSYGVAWDPGVVYGREQRWNVWAVFLHMHELGTAGSVALLKPDGAQECLLNVDDWDFHWQADYWYDEPTVLEPGDRLYVECEWRNPGEDIAWETDQEMCAAVLYVTEAP